MELYKKYRPRRLRHIVGQPNAVASLGKLLAKKRMPHTVLLSGPSGTGKTTAARILKKELGCADRDFAEINCATDRGIAIARDIQAEIGLAPWIGKCKIYYLDECHMLTREAQTAILKNLEDTPDHVYFILATTNPQGLLKTIITRSCHVVFKALEQEELVKLMTDVLDKCGGSVGSEEVLDKIAEAAEGSARMALVMLDQVLDLESEEAQLDAIAKGASEVQGIVLARTLFKKGANWNDVKTVLKDLGEADVEGVRRLVLSYATSIMLSGGPLLGKGYLVANAFRDNFYDSKKAGLILACYEALHSK